LKVAGTENTVVVSFLNYAAKEVSIAGQTNISVSLTQNSDQLSDVVVIGYGSVRKKDLTGSVVNISSKDFVKGQITSPEQLIAGKVAGVQITSNGGAPGSGSTIRIRGGASLNASNDPLIVIDNVPLSNNAISGVSNPLSLINPNDIESFSILKDASASAIYGSRASNGVIIITTKKGAQGKTKYNFNSQTSVGEVVNYVDVLNADEFTFYVEANGTADQKKLLGTANTNWQKEIYQSALTLDNNFSASGAYKTIPYRFSVSSLSQEGVLKTGKLDRTTVGLNLSPRLLNNSLKIDLNAKTSFSNSRFADQGAISTAVQFDPTKPVYSNDQNAYGGYAFGGYYEWLDAGSTTGLAGLAPKNPVGLLMQKQDLSNVNRTIANADIDYTLPFFKDLRLHTNVGIDISNGSGTIYIPTFAASAYNRFSGKGGVNNEYKQENTNLLAESYLNYSKYVENIESKFDVVAGYAYQEFKSKTFNFSDKIEDGTEVTVPNFPYDMPENRLVSFYGRFNYALKGKYSLTATIRQDGSSRFNADNRFATFPSFAAAWNLAEENMFKQSKVISTLKLRFGYGETGQQDGIGNYDYLSYYALSGQQGKYQFGNTFYNMYAPGGYYGGRKWEQTATTNLALDFGLFNNKLTGSLDIYKKVTSDLLNLIGQPAGTNFSNQIIANVGDMENKGVELGLNLQAINKANFNWDLGFNITYNENKITKLTISPDPNYPGNKFGGISGGVGNTIMINSVGYNRGSFFVFQQVYDEAGKPIEGLFVDRNKDGVINDKDQYQYQSVDPKIFLGFTSSMTYKKWSAGIVMRANIGNYMYNNIYSTLGTYKAISSLATHIGNASRNILETRFTQNGVNQLMSDYYIQNASFLRIDNINIGYNAGKVFNNKANLRINANIQNAFTLTKYKGLDPEISGGIDNNFYPRPRVIALGLNFDF
jgi:iron complex outermembrane receptor protein